MLINGANQSTGDIRKTLAKAVDDVGLFKENYISKGGSEQSKFRLRTHLGADAAEKFKKLALRQINMTVLAMQCFMRSLTQFYALCIRQSN